jgi:hypothetical protein
VAVPALISSREANRRLRPLALVSAALYSLFLLATPFEHHDLSCELKTPEHCIACVVSAVGAGPPLVVVPGAGELVDAGSAVPRDPIANSFALVARTTGRSPPATV